MSYQAPLDDLRTALATAGGLSDMIASGMLEGIDEDLVHSVLDEAARFAAEELAPLSAIGDTEPARLVDGKVVLPKDWAPTYRRWREAGWNALPSPVAIGGQGLPHVVAACVNEIWSSANLGFALGPLLTQGAVDALHMVGSEELKATYLPKMVSGEWYGTMNLTEPHAGTDLGMIKTRAEPQPDGSYRLKGTKIFISYGDHEITGNIIHTVLARLPDAPAGTRGISLFLVPKYLVGPDGQLGKRNDVHPVSVEHKLGIHGSPTCVMAYGQNEGAVGYLVGELNKGLNHMFIMMNRARLGVGVQGVAVAERARQRALAYAKERKQGRGRTTPAGSMAPIIEHADVRRNLLTMRALTSAARMVCVATARELDISERSPDAKERARAANRCALLTPVAKAFGTDIGVEVASLGIQVHGGTGFIEATGAAQHYRDARVLPIYEGTNGVQALDLVTRKLPLEGGGVVAALIGEYEGIAKASATSDRPGFRRMGERLGEANAALEKASRWLGGVLQTADPEPALAGATPYLRLLGIAAGGAYLARAALATGANGGVPAAAQVAVAQFFADAIAPQAAALERAITEGAGSVAQHDAPVFAA